MNQRAIFSCFNCFNSASSTNWSAVLLCFNNTTPLP